MQPKKRKRKARVIRGHLQKEGRGKPVPTQATSFRGALPELAALFREYAHDIHCENHNLFWMHCVDCRVVLAAFLLEHKRLRVEVLPNDT